MSDARRYALQHAWPDPRSRSWSRALQSCKSGHFSTATSSAIYNGSWQLTSDSYTTARSKFDRARFLIFGVAFVSRDFEVGRSASYEESTVSPVRGYCGLIYYIVHLMRNYRKYSDVRMESLAMWQLYSVDVSPFLFFHCCWKMESGCSYSISDFFIVSGNQK